MVSAFVLTATIAFADTNTAGSNQIISTNLFVSPTNLAQLLALPPEQLDKVDIAVMNLLCAEGLHGAEDMDVPQLLKTLDSWALWISINTKRHYYRFVNDPKDFNNSEGDFRMAFLSSTLQQQFGVLYNPARAEPRRVARVHP